MSGQNLATARMDKVCECALTSGTMVMPVLVPQAEPAPHMLSTSAQHGCAWHMALKAQVRRQESHPQLVRVDVDLPAERFRCA